ncbi:MAG: hypothetical protein AAFV86_20355, partial [Pseudomonadota bacterium]
MLRRPTVGRASPKLSRAYSAPITAYWTSVRRAPGIDRPAIAVHWPACQPHGFNTVLDVGADVRAEPRTLVQYAVM